MNKGMGLLTLGLTMALTVGSARADYVIYTNRATFEAAIQSETTENFNELGPNFKFYQHGLSQANGLTQPLNITESGSYLISTAASNVGGFYPANGTFLIGGIDRQSTDGISVALPTNTYNAAGADVTNFTVNGTITFFGTTSQGESFTGSVAVTGSDPTGPLGFLGITTTSPTDYVTSLTFQAAVGSSTQPVLDNFSFGQAVPEPASMALFAAGAGVLAAGAARRRFRRAQG